MRRKIRRKRSCFKSLVMPTLILMLVLICTIVLPFNCFKAAAGEQSSPQSYRTYVVHQGDTLWGLADTYMEASSFQTHQSYINEVMRANCLENTMIYDGQLIIIP